MALQHLINLARIKKSLYRKGKKRFSREKMTILLGTIAENGGMLRTGGVIHWLCFDLPVSNSLEGGSTTTRVHL